MQLGGNFNKKMFLSGVSTVHLLLSEWPSSQESGIQVQHSQLNPLYCVAFDRFSVSLSTCSALFLQLEQFSDCMVHH